MIGKSRMPCSDSLRARGEEEKKKGFGDVVEGKDGGK